ncbi:response regulator [Nocardioides sp. GCM10027113]|uniref:response regulator n=1 Tax=unclassified Nocardioides TaxID=2615069 RepID=UPI0036170239
MPQGSRRVLVVDDDAMIREVSQMALEAVAGWEVLQADGGSTALVIAEEHRPDAILLDVMMPDMDGLTTFRRLQESETTRDIPVVLVTAKVQSGPRPVWDGLAIAGVIPKPFDPMTLADEVSRMLGWT